MPRFPTLVRAGVLIAVAAGPARGGTLVFSPSIYDYGTVSVSGGAVLGEVTITNFGAATTITGITTSGACTEFTITPPAPYPIVLANNESMVVQLAYDPANRVSDQCVCTTNDNNGVADSFTLRGDGAAPQLQVFQSSLNFSDQPWNSATHETLAVAVENVGEEPFSAENLGRALQSGAHFSLAPTVGTFPVAAGAQVLIPMLFDPASEGAKSDVLTVSLTNDSPADPNPTVTLNGTGTAAVAVEPASGGASGIRAVGPSPTRGWVRVQAALGRAGALEVAIWDLAGRRVAGSRAPVAGAGSHSVEFHAGRDWSPAPGVYLVSVQLDGGLLGTRRVVVVK